MKWTNDLYYAVLIFVVGFIVSLALALFFLGPNISIAPDKYIEVISTSVMALVALVASLINYTHLRDKRRSRIWEMNKKVILDLVKYLNIAKSATKIVLHNLDENRFMQQLQSNGDYSYVPDLLEESNWDHVEGLKKTLDKFKSQHSPFISKSFSDAIHNFSEVENKIEAGNDVGALDIDDCYEMSLNNISELIKETLAFCEEISGIKVIYPA